MRIKADRVNARQTGNFILAARAVGAYARVRRQFKTPIARFEGVEEALARLDTVAEVAVIGRPDPEWGQVVTAVIVATDPDHPPALESLRDAVKAVLPSFCAPKRLEIVASLPRTALGKVERGTLTGTSPEPD